MLLQAHTLSANTEKMMLKTGEKKTIKFQVGNPEAGVLLWVSGRIVLPQGEQEGAYALQMKVNGTVLAPKNTSILNRKQMIYDKVKVEKNVRYPDAVFSFDELSNAWYLKADSDYTAFNDPVSSSPYAPVKSWETLASSAYRSHYYEYLLKPDTNIIQKGDNILEMLVNLPGRLKNFLVEISVSVQPVEEPALFFQRPLTEFIFPCQVPSMGDVIEKELILSACAGEREPVSFALYSIQPLKNVNFEIETLLAQNSKSIIEPNSFKRYFVDCTELENLVPVMPWLEQSLVPQLLKPLEEGTPELKAGHSLRFVADLLVPDNIAPGKYTGNVIVRSGSTVLKKIPLHVEIYPFKLAEPKQKYWMWRLQWSSIDEPDNIACLQDIKDHGIYGLALISGAAFKVNLGPDGNLKPDTSEWESLAKILKDTGLSNRVHDRSVQTVALSIGLKKAGLANIPASPSWFAVHALTDPLTGKAVTLERTNLKSVDTEKMDEIRKKMPEIEKTMIEVMKIARDEAEKLGLDLRLFPVDEPDGTSWRRAWTKWISDLAHKAGLKTWSTHNWPLNWGTKHWESGIDESCMGGRIFSFYSNPDTIVSDDLKLNINDIFRNAIPIIGRHREGPEYGFTGTIDEVRIYNRPLTDEEILRQHEQPAKDGLLAYYPLDEARGETAFDASGNDHHASVKNGAVWTDGKIGKALRFFADENDRLHPPSVPLKGDGWSISFWYNGAGTPFGWGYHYYCQGASGIILRSPEGIQHLQFSGGSDIGFWNHMTISIDNKNKQIKALVRNEQQRNWYQENIKWTYIQARGFTMPWIRYETGVLSYYARGLENITIFCYDWNPTPKSNLCLVYPENYNRFANRPNTKWYGTLGWLAVREGIDDARYLHTLYLKTKERAGDEKRAWNTILEAISYDPNSIANWDRGTNHILRSFGNFEAMRKKIAEQIMQKKK